MYIDWRADIHGKKIDSPASAPNLGKMNKKCQSHEVVEI